MNDEKPRCMIKAKKYAKIFLMAKNTAMEDITILKADG